MAVHANKFRTKKFLLLFTVLEKEMSNLTNEENDNEEVVVIGKCDDDQRKRIMT